MSILLRQMEPQLNEGIYVFCSVHPGHNLPPENILATFREREGLSIILNQSVADRYHLSYSFKAAWITLNIHSALEAVGLTAAVATSLADHDISCNVVAAYYHDHLFVPWSQAEEAMNVLRDLMQNFRG